jgi:hypothetical protein
MKKTFLCLIDGCKFCSETIENPVDFQDLCKIVEFILCLPGSTASVERMFLLMNAMWSTDKSSFSVETMRATLVVRQNCVMEYEKFMIRC